MKSDRSECQLKVEPFFQCCCKCVYHKPTHEHCSTNRALREKLHESSGKPECICHIQNGWACCPPESGRAYINWPEHSCGCEMYTTAEDEKNSLAKAAGRK